MTAVDSSIEPTHEFVSIDKVDVGVASNVSLFTPVVTNNDSVATPVKEVAQEPSVKKIKVTLQLALPRGVDVEPTATINPVLPVTMIETTKKTSVPCTDMCKPWAQALHVWCPSLYDVTGQTEEFPAPRTLDASPLGELARALTSLSELVVSEGSQPVVAPKESEAHEPAQTEAAKLQQQKEDVIEELETTPFAPMEEAKSAAVDTIDKLMILGNEVENKAAAHEEPATKSILTKSVTALIVESKDATRSVAAQIASEPVVPSAAVLPVCESNAMITSSVRNVVEVLQTSVSDNWALAVDDKNVVFEEGTVPPTIKVSADAALPNVVMVESPPMSAMWRILENLPAPKQTTVTTSATTTVATLPLNVVAESTSFTNESVSMETVEEQLDAVQTNSLDANAVLVTQVDNVDIAIVEVVAPSVSMRSTSRAPRWVVDQLLVKIGTKSSLNAPVATVVDVEPLPDVEGYTVPSKLSLDMGHELTDEMTVAEVTSKAELIQVEVQEQVAFVAPSLEAPPATLTALHYPVVQVEQIPLVIHDVVATSVDFTNMADVDVVAVNVLTPPVEPVEHTGSTWNQPPRIMGTSSKSEQFLSHIMAGASFPTSESSDSHDADSATAHS
jgi:hypothetical protein